MGVNHLGYGTESNKVTCNSFSLQACDSYVTRLDLITCPKCKESALRFQRLFKFESGHDFNSPQYGFYRFMDQSFNWEASNEAVGNIFYHIAKTFEKVENARNE